MPYNTRRKSLSLESLGIHVPSSSRANRSPPSAMSLVSSDQSQPPVKKVKRSHTLNSTDSTPRKTSIKFSLNERPKSRAAHHTPPPSPRGEAGHARIDIQGIDDDIVVGVIRQLEETGNRPHLLKELAAVLSVSLQVVQSSANPAAIISSRLANYLKRSWTPLARCPLGKTLVGTHPKRVYYFLTTCEHQPIPENPQLATPLSSRIITPSLSSAADDEDQADHDSRSRDRMSPSPELELSGFDFDDDATSPFSEHGSHPPTAENHLSHNRRAEVIPLERDEREFSNMVNLLQQRSRSQSEAATKEKKETPTEESTIAIDVEETEEHSARKNSEAAAALFGTSAEHLDAHPTPVAFSSPMIKPVIPPPVLSQKRPLEVDVRMVDEAWALFELKSPEHVELDELDVMFDNY